MLFRRGKKISFIIGGVILVLAGVFVGSFLVLRSATSQGQFSLLDGKELSSSRGASEDFLEDLYNLQNSLEENLTESFITELEKVTSAETENSIGEDFVSSSVLPILRKGGEEIFADIPDKELNIDPLADKEKYLEEMRVHIFVSAGAWQKVIGITLASIDKPQTKEDFTPVSNILSLSIEELKEQTVPASYVDFHKKVLKMNSAIHALVANMLTKENNDPLRGILTLASLEEIQRMGQETLIEFSQIQNSLKENAPF